jgi:hypothetical protein
VDFLEWKICELLFLKLLSKQKPVQLCITRIESEENKSKQVRESSKVVKQRDDDGQIHEAE